MDSDVSLEEILNVLGEPVDGRAVWALLVQAYDALQRWIEYSCPGSKLTITPESMMLNRSGEISFSTPISHHVESKYVAPESRISFDSSDLQKGHIYSLGMTVTSALHHGDNEEGIPASELLKTILTRMTAANPEDRPTMEELAHYTMEKEGTEQIVCGLVSFVLGDPKEPLLHEEDNLEAELLEVLNHAPGPQFESGTSSLASILNDEDQRGENAAAGMYTSLPELPVMDSSDADGELHSPSDNYLSTFDHKPAQQAHNLNQYLYSSHFCTPSRRKRETASFESEKETSMTHNTSEEQNDFVMNIKMNPLTSHASEDQTNLRLDEHSSSLHDVTQHETDPEDSSHNVGLQHTSCDTVPLDECPISPLISPYDEASQDEASPNIDVHDNSPKFDLETVTQDLELGSHDADYVQDATNSDPVNSNQLPIMETSSGHASPTESQHNYSTGDELQQTIIPDIIITEPVSSIENEGNKCKAMPNEDHFYAELEGPEDMIQHNPKYSLESESYVGNKEEVPDEQDTPLLIESCSVGPTVTEKGKSQQKLGHILGSDFNSFYGIKMDTEISTNPKKTLQPSRLIRSDKVILSRHARDASISTTTKKVSKSSRQRRSVEVVLLNGQSFLFYVDETSTCHDLFNQVVALQSVEETYIFGLALQSSSYANEIFLEFDSKLSEYAPKQWVKSGSGRSPFRVFFRVKHYVENVNQLRYDQTRHLYYLQLRRDILESRTYCNEETALRLAAFAIQAELGDLATMRSYKLDDFIATQVIKKLGEATIKKTITDLHAELKGLSPPEAQRHYMLECQTLPEYGMIFYQVATSAKEKLGSTWLGLSVRGIVMYNVHKGVKTPFSHWPWSDLKNLSCANKKFIIEPDHGKRTKFYTHSHMTAQYILHLSIYYHRFHLLTKRQAATPSYPVEQRTDSTSEQSVAVNAQIIDYNEVPVDAAGLSHSSGLEALLHLPDGEIYDIELIKTEKSLGLRLAGGINKPVGGGYIYVKAIVPDSIADKSCIQDHDILLKVNGNSLYEMTHKDAASFISEAKHCVLLQLLRPTDSQWLNTLGFMDKSWTEAHWASELAQQSYPQHTKENST